MHNLVDYIPSSKTVKRGVLPHGLRKVTTPNSINDGIHLIESRSNKQVEKGYGAFICELQKNAIVVSRITNKRIAQASRYFGSAQVGDAAGNLITKEYYQFIPKDQHHALYILYHLRTAQCQDIAEWASGTGGQQRIDVEFILNQPLPMPTPATIKYAESALRAIEFRVKNIDKLRQEIQQLTSGF